MHDNFFSNIAGLFVTNCMNVCTENYGISVNNKMHLNERIFRLLFQMYLSTFLKKALKLSQNIKLFYKVLSFLKHFNITF